MTGPKTGQAVVSVTGKCNYSSPGQILLGKPFTCDPRQPFKTEVTVDLAYRKLPPPYNTTQMVGTVVGYAPHVGPQPTDSPASKDGRPKQTGTFVVDSKNMYVTPPCVVAHDQTSVKWAICFPPDWMEKRWVVPEPGTSVTFTYKFKNRSDNISFADAIAMSSVQ